MTEKPTYQELERRLAELQAELKAIRGKQTVKSRWMAPILEDSGLNLLFAIINNAQNVIYVKDVDGRFILANRQLCDILGLPAREVLGKTPVELFPSDLAARAMEHDRQIIRSKSAQTFGEKVELNDGVHEYIAMKFPIFGDQGDLVAVGGIATDITDHVRAEENYRQSEEKYRTLVENAGEAIFIAQQGMLKFVNKKTESLSGYTNEELIFKPFHELIHEDDRALVLDHHFKRLQGLKMPPRYSFRIITRSGEVRWVELNAVLVDWQGEPASLNFLHDITGRKRAEEALEKRVLALTMPLDDSESIKFEDLFNLEDIQRLQDEFAAATGVASIITRTDGTPITESSNFCHLCRDIIRKTEKGCSNCYRSDALIGRMSSEGPTIQQCMSGGLWDAGAAISVGGRHIANWLIGQVRDETQTEESIRVYAREIGADEDEAAKAFRKVPGMSQAQFGRVAQALFTLANQLSATAYQNVQQARFISDRKRAEKEKDRIEAQYRQSQKVEAIGRLAGGVAHDLNNLLTPIIGYGELLSGEFSLGDLRRESIDQIMQAGYGARDLVRQLLAFSRKQKLKYQPLNLNKTIRGFQKLLRRTVREDIELSIIMSPDIQTIRGDIGQIEQVIMNLFVNAQQAMPNGGKLTIETAMAELDEAYAADQPHTQVGQYVMLAVSDNGLGMDEETQEHIFEPFFSTKGEQGTGLGLATVYGIVKQHGGHIWLYSEMGKGTIFKVYLPVSEEMPIETHSEKETAVDMKGTETILLVEDNAQVRRLASVVLRRQGYKLLIAEHGDKALRLLRNHKGKVDLLLTDVVMPDMNGKELLTKVEEICPHIRVLYMSGYTDDIIAQRGVLDESARFIEKPFTVQGLATKVRAALTSKQAGASLF